MQNRAQGAIEYLLIIGAAILIVAIVILAVTGILSGGQSSAGASSVQAESANQGLKNLAFTNIGGHDYSKSDTLVTTLSGLWDLGGSSSVLNSVGGSNTGTCPVACPSVSQGLSGNAASFNSSADQYVQIVPLPNGDKETYAIWFKPTQPGVVASFLVSTESSGNDPESFVHWRSQLSVGPSNKVYWNVGSWGGQQTANLVDPATGVKRANVCGPDDYIWGAYVIYLESPAAISFNEWHFAALTVDYKPFSARFYLDGQLQQDSNTTYNCNNEVLYSWLGRRKGAGGLNFNGEIDQFAMWDKILSPSEIAQMYADSK